MRGRTEDRPLPGGGKWQGPRKPGEARLRGLARTGDQVAVFSLRKEDLTLSSLDHGQRPPETPFWFSCSRAPPRRTVFLSESQRKEKKSTSVGERTSSGCKGGSPLVYEEYGHKKGAWMGVPVVAQWLMHLTRNHEVSASIPGLAHWVGVLRWAVCGVGLRHGSDLTLLWLWCRLVATAPIGPLAWELPYAAWVRPSKDKKKERKKKKWARIGCTGP